FITGDGAAEADSGSTALLGFDLMIGLPLAGGAELGVGMQVARTVPRAIWGTEVSEFGRTEVFFDATFLNFVLAYRQALGPRVLLTLEPGLDIVLMNGRYAAFGNVNVIEYSAGGVGGHGALGLTFMLGSDVGIMARGGYRYVRAPATFKDEDSSTGFSQTLCCGDDGDDPLEVDWSGPYANFGIVWSLRRR
ncbi:MAG: hypothetical protein HY703_01270, partial [Gemmatimonadetes bacterium]|nr:hypothetical protein [Gemmatimonadota bacterium]